MNPELKAKLYCHMLVFINEIARHPALIGGKIEIYPALSESMTEAAEAAFDASADFQRWTKNEGNLK